MYRFTLHTSKGAIYVFRDEYATSSGQIIKYAKDDVTLANDLDGSGKVFTKIEMERNGISTEVDKGPLTKYIYK